MIFDSTLRQNAVEEDYWKKLNDYKDSLLAQVSHDLRTPLNGMIMSIQSISPNDTKEEIMEKTKMALSNGHLLDFMIADILDYSMISTGQLRVVPENFQLRAVTDQIFQLFIEQFRMKEVELKIKFAHRIQETLSLFNDSKRLTQALINLVSNSLKFTEKGSVTVEFEPYNNYEEVMEIEQEASDEDILIPQN